MGNTGAAWTCMYFPPVVCLDSPVLPPNLHPAPPSTQTVDNPHPPPKKNVSANIPNCFSWVLLKNDPELFALRQTAHRFPRAYLTQRRRHTARLAQVSNKWPAGDQLKQLIQRKMFASSGLRQKTGTFVLAETQRQHGEPQKTEYAGNALE